MCIRDSIPALTLAGAFLFALGRMAAAQGTPSETTPADDLLRAAKFAEAKAAFQAEPASPRTATKLGEIAILENNLKEAEAILKPIASDDNTRARSLLAEALYRQDRFDEASRLYEQAGRKPKAAQLTTFAGQVPYEIRSGPPATEVPFITTDPLPVVEVRLNGTDPVYFLIDTGGNELVIDPEVADRLKLPRFGSETGMFAGAKSAPVEFSRLDSFTIGEFEVHNLPAKLLKTSRFAGIVGRPVSGIIGTVFLYHFRATLDYPGGRRCRRSGWS